jgi:signal transduction histidine kinase
LRIKDNSTFLITPRISKIHSRPATLYKNLNNKIITYFIAFAFLPLLIFSILGYYLNKDMLTRINYSNLEIMNSNYAREIQFYLDHKKSVLQAIADRLPPGPVVKNQAILISEGGMTNPAEFTLVGRVAKNELIPWLAGVCNSGIFSISHKLNQHEVLVGLLKDQELRNILYSVVPEFKNYVYFPDRLGLLTAAGMVPLQVNNPQTQRLSELEQDTCRQWQSYDSGSAVFTAGSRLLDFDMLVLTEINAHDFYHNLSSFRNTIILANLFFAVLIIGLAIFYSRQITTPVNQLVKSVQAMSRGDLETPIPLRTNDQLQILAQEFEHLRQKLQEYYQGMEEKVDIRTRELRQAQAQISHQEKMASLGLMAAGIAHEIGNPLTSISSMAQVIKRKTTDEKITDYANNILKNIERISRIVRELVDFSKPSPHKEVEADINEIVNSAVSIIKYDRRSKKINFNLELQPDLPKTVLVPDHLLQVFLNILINAVDASEGLDTEIRVSSYADNRHIQVDITDRGCGIAAENINRIFEPFFTTKGVGKGTGLGLTVSYGLIKKLQGEIKVQSQIDQGSTFSVVLPVMQETEAKLV